MADVKTRTARKKATGEEVTLYLYNGQWSETPPPAETPAPAPQQQTKSEPSIGETAKDYAWQGATFGGFDELAALGGALFAGAPRTTGRGLDAPLMTPPETAAAAYTDLQAAQQDNLDRGFEHNPKTAMAAAGLTGMGSALLSLPLGAARAAAALVPSGVKTAVAAAPPITRAALTALPMGAVGGGVQGALSAHPGERLAGAAEGAKGGAVLGPMLGGGAKMVGTLAGGAGNAMWRAFGDPKSALSSSDAPDFAAAQQAGTQPRIMGSAFEPTPQMMDEASAMAPLRLRGSDKAFDDASKLITDAIDDKVKTAPTLDDAASRQLQQLQIETNRALAFAQKVQDDALAKYPQMRVSTEELRNTTNALIARGNIADVTEGARELASKEAANIVGVQGDNALLPTDVHTPHGNAAALQKFADALLRRIDNEDELREMMKPGMGSAAEQADAAIALKQLDEARKASPGPPISAQTATLPEMWRHARFSIDELVGMRRHIDGAAKAASSMKLDAQARAWNDINVTVRKMLGDHAPDVAKASDEAHLALNVSEANLEQFGLPGHTVDFEPIPGNQTRAVRDRLAQPGMEPIVEKLLGPERYAHYVDADQLLETFGLPRGIRAIEPSRRVGLQNTVTSQLKSNPAALSDAIARLGQAPQAARTHAVGSRATEALRAAEGNPAERTALPWRMMMMSRPLVRTSAALRSLDSYPPQLGAIGAGIQMQRPEEKQ